MPNARAVKLTGAGDVEVLSLGEIEVDDPGPGQILVEVAAAGLNRADILQRRGLYPAPPGVVADVPGLEYAGTVAAIGPGVSLAAPGDRVMGIVAGGAMATHLLVHERELIPVPRGMSLEHAAAIPEAFLTAYDALAQARAELGEWVLIHAVGSGVGTAAVQLARLAGLHTIGTSRSSDKLGRCVELGVDHPVLVPSSGESAGNFAGDVLAHTSGAGVQVILDTVGAAYFEQNLSTLATGGRMVLIGLLGGARAQAPLALLLQKRCTVIGTVLRSRALEEKAALARRFGQRVVPLFATGALGPVLDTVMPMAEIAAAHQRMEKNQSFGKIVLRW
jgi:NADPH:quinone reductase